MVRKYNTDYKKKFPTKEEQKQRTEKLNSINCDSYAKSVLRDLKNRVKNKNPEYQEIKKR